MNCSGRTAGAAGLPAVVLLLVACSALVSPPPAFADDQCQRTVMISDGVRIHVEQGNRIELEALPEKGEGYYLIAERFTGSRSNWRRIQLLNGTRSLIETRWYRIPFDLLTPPYRVVALFAAFPHNRMENGHFIHRVLCDASGDRGERLADIADWYTGDQGRAGDLAGLMGQEAVWDLRVGEEVAVPVEWLLPQLQAWAAEQTARDIPLEYGRDDQGEYAIYRLKQGEALYSSVVIRFTGLMEADEVNEMAALIAERSGIKDVTDIPTGFGVRIPAEYLSDDMLPAGHPERLAYELNRFLSSGFEKAGPGLGLDGITVILDPGHGGRDPGAIHHGVWEDDHVYDIACRIKKVIETRSSGRVIMTVKDRSSGFTPSDRRPLTRDQDEDVMVSPAYALTEPGAAREGVNFRWALANYQFKELVAAGADEQSVVFASLHADALHPALSGTMIYILGARYGNSCISLSGPTYQRRSEVAAYPRLDYYKSARSKSEGLSRGLAEEVLASFRRNDLPVHGYQPIRNHLARKRRSFAPAVLRNNIVPLKMLIEICNLRNEKDSRRMTDPAYRQAVAEAFVEALSIYFDGKNSKGNGRAS
jgi:N-acetylmuramoyl-L-alanine amidase